MNWRVEAKFFDFFGDLVSWQWLSYFPSFEFRQSEGQFGERIEDAPTGHFEHCYKECFWTEVWSYNSTYVMNNEPDFI